MAALGRSFTTGEFGLSGPVKPSSPDKPLKCPSNRAVNTGQGDVRRPEVGDANERRQSLDKVFLVFGIPWLEPMIAHFPSRSPDVPENPPSSSELPDVIETRMIFYSWS